MQSLLAHFGGSPRARLMLAGALLFIGGCKDPEPPGSTTPPISVRDDSASLRETFSDGDAQWEHVEGTWQLRGAGDSRVLAQTATNRAFPVTLWKSRRFSDVDVTVRFKPISGDIDASGGIVFRARDGANYYVVRANSLEDNFRLYTMVDGSRRKIAGVHIPEPDLGVWHTLRVVAVGDHIQAYLDDRLLIDHRDGTFADGWVGLWTKADAVTEFDDVVVRGVARGPAPLEDTTGDQPPSKAAPTSTATISTKSFDLAQINKLPEGWSAPVGEWRVETVEAAASGSRAFVQRASNRSPVFNVALVEASSHADVDISVRLRAREGRIDQGGGVVWRATDARNYYIARYNPLEDNFRVYTVKDGRRRQIGTADVRVDHGAWHTLRCTMRGDHIECFLDGEKHIDVHDGTFTGAGKVGLWTKADARTEFDDLSFSSAGEVSP
ncbi:MAG: hypothetical protein RMA76_05040 [Deltaproteobacteria bacterium]